MRRGTLTDEMCTFDDDLGRCPSTFNAASVSVGALWDVVPQTLELKLDLSSASRAPNADEAYMLSSAPTFPIYVYSDPSLGVETTWGASPTLGLDVSWLQAELSGFANRIDDYIHFAPELDADGEPNFDVTIRGAFPRYSFRAINARFHGADGSFLFAPHSVVSLRVQGSVVRAIDLQTQQFLVGTPPDSGVATVMGQLRDLGPLTDSHLELSLEGVARQSRVDPALDLAPAPDGYVLLHASVGTSIELRRRAWTLGIEGHNLLNTVSRDYNSLLRYYADQPGRDIRVHLSTDI
jgi:iron complex outermembrane receptor protein